MLKEVHVTIGQKTGRDLASRDITISISLIGEAGTELNRRRSDIVHEETLMNQRRLDGGSGGAGPRSSGEVTNKIQRSGQAQYATSQWRERPTMLPVPRLDSEGNVSIPAFHGLGGRAVTGEPGRDSSAGISGPSGASPDRKARPTPGNALAAASLGNGGGAAAGCRQTARPSTFPRNPETAAKGWSPRTSGWHAIPHLNICGS